MERSLLLVNPRCGEGSKYPPLSLIWLASYIEKQGYFVDIIDANALELRDEDLIQNIIQAVPSPAKWIGGCSRCCGAVS